MVSPESNEADLENRGADGPDEELTDRQIVDALQQLNRQLAEQGRQLAEQGRRQAEQGQQLTEQGRQQAEIRQQQAETNRQLAETNRRQAELRREFVERTDKMDVHLAYLRGAHAINAAQRNASLIADDMGYQMILQLPREELIGFSNMARGVGKPEGDVKSFREADLVLLARDDSGHPTYIAVEASYTVSGRDIRRARRNAEYLQELTGLSAKGAVAGVEIAQGREQNAITDGVHCYHIPVRDLESD